MSRRSSSEERGSLASDARKGSGTKSPAMLPASLQTPAAVILLAGGLLACFAGYRIFRVVLGIYGFIGGALLASNIVGTENTWLMIGAALGGGLVGALILIAAYFVGVALIGAGLGAVVANLLWAATGGEPHIAIVIILAIARRAGGAGAAAIRDHRRDRFRRRADGRRRCRGADGQSRSGGSQRRASVYSVYPLNPMPETFLDAGGALILGIAGVAVQLMVTAKGKK